MNIEDLRRRTHEVLSRKSNRVAKPCPFTGYLVTCRDRNVAYFTNRHATLAEIVAEALDHYARLNRPGSRPADLAVWMDGRLQAVVFAVDEVKYFAPPFGAGTDGRPRHEAGAEFPVEAISPEEKLKDVLARLRAARGAQNGAGDDR